MSKKVKKEVFIKKTVPFKIDAVICGVCDKAFGPQDFLPCKHLETVVKLGSIKTKGKIGIGITTKSKRIDIIKKAKKVKKKK